MYTTNSSSSSNCYNYKMAIQCYIQRPCRPNSNNNNNKWLIPQTLSAIDHRYNLDKRLHSQWNQQIQDGYTMLTHRNDFVQAVSIKLTAKKKKKVIEKYKRQFYLPPTYVVLYTTHHPQQPEPLTHQIQKCSH